MELDAVALTRELIAVDTVNPPGRELVCAELVAAMLAPAGFRTELHPLESGRSSLVARLDGDAAPICFTGHFDTVPLGAAAWSVDPFAAEIRSGRVYGRGSSDMKSGLAAMIVAALRLAAERHRRAGLVLVLTAGEEKFCDGARQMVEAGVIPAAGALIVGEPTGNQPLVAHKGCSGFRMHSRGVTAHASTPERGDNAIYKAAEAVLKLRDLDFGVDPHPVLGTPTLNVGVIHGGMNSNSVPDSTTVAIDVRTIPAQEPDEVLERLRGAVAPHAQIEAVVAGKGIATDPADPWVVHVFDLVEAVAGRRPQAAAAPYFTDGAFLKAACGDPPTLILGPGEIEQAHKTDEWCEVIKIEQAAEIYWQLARDWCLQG